MCRLLPRSRGLPRYAGGSASAPLLSRPAQALLTLRPAGSLNRPRRPLSRGFDPTSYPAKPLVSYQSNRQLSGWNPPPLVVRAIGAHCMFLDSYTNAAHRTCLLDRDRWASEGPYSTDRTPWHGSERRYSDVRNRDPTPRPGTTAMGAMRPSIPHPRYDRSPPIAVFPNRADALDQNQAVIASGGQEERAGKPSNPLSRGTNSRPTGWAARRRRGAAP
jgi:hypothetical protein